MRIGILYDDKCYENEVMALKDSLLSQGKEVTLIVPGKKFEESPDKITVPSLGFTKRFGAFLSRIQSQSYYEKLKSLPIDEMHAYCFSSLAVLGMSLANYREIPFLFTFRTKDFSYPNEKQKSLCYLTDRQISLIIEAMLGYDTILLSDQEGRKYLRTLGFNQLILNSTTTEDILSAYEKSASKWY